MVPAGIISNYNITLVSPSQFAVSNTITNYPSTAFRLDENILYNATIDTSFCNGIILSESFMLGMK